MRHPLDRSPVKLPPALLLALLSAISGPALTVASSHAPTPGSFVWISDMHFDPFYAPNPADTRDADRAVHPVTAMLDKLVDRTDPNAPTWKDHTLWGAVFAASPLQNVYNQRGADANDATIQTVLGQAATQAGKLATPPDFVLITGDFLGHDFGADYKSLAPSGVNNTASYTRFVAQTLKYLALSTRTAFPAPPIVATLGNNEAYCGDYDLHRDVDLGDQTSFDFLSDTAQTFLTYFLPDLDKPANQSEKKAFLKTFLAGGYYSMPVPNGGGSRFVVLNSIPFMAKYPCEQCTSSDSQTACTQCGAADGSYPPPQSSCNAAPVIDAMAQQAWLTTEAAAANRTWVVAHVPPGIGCYSTSAYWTSPYIDTYQNLFTGATPANIAGTLAAHSHMASFKLVRDAAGNALSFVLQSPSIGTNHGNNPTFGLLTHDRGTLEIESYQVWYLDLGETTPGFSHYQFAGLSGSITAATLASLYDDLEKTGGSDWNTFAIDYGARAPVCSQPHQSGCVSLGDLSQTQLTCLDALE